MEDAIIRVENLFIDYRLGKTWHNVIHDVTLNIRPDTIHGLVGESGSGKSTLALALMRYLAPNARIPSGNITFDGQDLLSKSTREMRDIWGQLISLVPQDSLAALNPSYTVGDQIAEITRRHMGIARRESAERAVEMLHRVKISDPADVAKRYPHQLSGGMLQRVAIAMALSTSPKFLILDEPTTALDVTTQVVILDLFRALIHDNHAAALYVSHDLGTIAQLCDDVTVLYGGEIMESAPVKTLFAAPTHPYTIGLLRSLPRYSEESESRLETIAGIAPSLANRPTGCVFAPRCPIANSQCHAEKPPLTATDDGGLVRCWRWRDVATEGLGEQPKVPLSQAVSAETDKPLLAARNIVKHFGSRSVFDKLTGQLFSPVRAVDDASITIRHHSTLGLVGESGSGKTTLARCIVALNSADSGEIELDELPISNRLNERPKTMLRDMQMVFQNPADTLNPYHTVGQALGRTLKRLSLDALSPAEIESRVVDLLQSVRLTADYAQRYPAELSGGEKQRVAIARAFAADPALVVADEPTSSLDASVQAVIMNLLKDLRIEKGASYLLISHDLDVIAYLADWIAVMYLGQIVEEGSTHAVYASPYHPYTEALISAIPTPDPAIDNPIIYLEGEVPSAKNIPSGCRFHTRCPRKIGAICETEEPPWQDAGEGHCIRCHIDVAELIRQQNSPQEQRRGTR
jgi:peptide/nickel transport system ATP-binding protein